MTETNSDTLLISMQGISKVFPGVQALTNVDFSLKYGEIHALMGGNGAGKSTLIKVLTGVEHPDSGHIFLAGKEVHVRSPQHAQSLGISTVYQEVNLCPNLTVAENILIGRAPMRLGSIDWKKLNAQAQEIMNRVLGMEIDVTVMLGSYSVAIQQMVAIVRALEIGNAKVLILDEPTSSLSRRETEQLFEVMRRLKSEGVGIIFITHFLDQVYEITDRITIIRNGGLVGTFETASMTRLELITKMIGKTIIELEDLSRIKANISKHISGDLVLETQDLGQSGQVEPISLTLHAGEVLGLAGLVGAGRTETVGLIFGLETPDSGEMSVAGKKVRHFSPLDSIKRGLALLPEDRKAAGIVDELTVRENIVLALQAGQGWFKYINLAKQYEIAEKYMKLLEIATPSADQQVKNLSGGNQQKVILARWLATNPRVLILDEPTRGIDVGTKAEIQKLVLLLADEGKACIFISSELEEVLRTSHRIAVMSDHRKIAEFSGDTSEHEIMRVMAGE
ncbi:MAG TPA: sugar ABC transporter ATP-binding protein [Anaerolineaceae bacterium]|nr:sugar ABC transporter ATP-binding protein [Anaerolineaceae bacterium]HPN50324.1 sugar ABC transporter ATP-binding protein [Anaerolineaceae bacterium]